MRTLRPPLQTFVIIMDDKLLANDYRRGWRGCDNKHLFNLLEDRMKDLRDALINNAEKAAIDSHCADVANIAMMISDIQRR